MSIIKKVMNIFSLKNYLASEGVRISEPMAAAIAEWNGFYRERSRLSLASGVSSEIARLVTLELKSGIAGSARADFLNSQYSAVISEIRKAVELACAGGGIVLKPYVTGGKIKVGFVSAGDFFPLEYSSSGDISGAVFLDRYIQGNRVFTRVERHIFEEDLYKIYNTAFVSQNGSDIGRKVSLDEVDAWKSIEPCVAIKGISKPLFAYFKMPMANMIDTSSPLGVSVFAKAIPLMRDAEEQYKRLLWEFESGERALYVDEAAVRRDSSGRHILPDKRLYRLLNTGDDELFRDWSPELRDKSILSGLNEILRRLEFSTGLAYGTLSDVRDIDRTAEEFRASKQRSYTQICDIQAALKTALCDLVSAMDALCDLYCLAPSGNYEVSFEFDDGIAADRKTEFEEKMKLLEKGIMQPWEMRAWYFGEERKTAMEALPRSACGTVQGDTSAGRRVGA